MRKQKIIKIEIFSYEKCEIMHLVAIAVGSSVNFICTREKQISYLDFANQFELKNQIQMMNLIDYSIHHHLVSLAFRHLSTKLN